MTLHLLSKLYLGKRVCTRQEPSRQDKYISAQKCRIKGTGSSGITIVTCC